MHRRRSRGLRTHERAPRQAPTAEDRSSDGRSCRLRAIARSAGGAARAEIRPITERRQAFALHLHGAVVRFQHRSRLRRVRPRARLSRYRRPGRVRAALDNRARTEWRRPPKRLRSTTKPWQPASVAAVRTLLPRKASNPDTKRTHPNDTGDVWRRGAGISTTNSRMGNEQVKSFLAPYAQGHRGRHSTS